MPCIEINRPAQAVSAPANHYPSPTTAIALACERFSNLCAEGILPRKAHGTPIDPAHVAIAMRFLNGVRKTKRATCHTHDLMQAVRVPPGAIIAAAIALGFSVHSWLRGLQFGQHAMIGANLNDVKMANQIGRAVSMGVSGE